MKKLGSVVSVALLCWLPCTAAAQQDASALSTVNETPASLVVWNRTLAVFRSQLSGAVPRARADAAAARIEAALDRLTPESITARTVNIGDERLTIVASGTEVLFAIHERDLPQDSAATLDAAGALTAGRLQALLRERAAQRRWSALARSFGLSVLATLLFGATWFLMARIRHRVVRATARLATRHVARDVVAGIDPRSLVSSVLAWIIGAASFALVASAAYVWLTFILGRFAYSRPWGARLGEVLLDTVSGIAAGFVHAIPGLIAIGAIVLVTRAISRAVGAWFRAVELEHVTVSWLDPLSARAARKLVVAGIWLFALTVAYPYVPGANTDAFKGVSVLVGLMVSLGSAGVIGQIMAYASASVARYVVMARLHEQILDVFNEHGVQIMSPHFEGQPDGAVVVPRSQWFARPAADPAEGLEGTDVRDR